MEHSDMIFLPGDFDAVTECEQPIEQEEREPSGIAREIVTRILQDRAAVISGGILLFIIVGAVLFPMLSSFDFASQNVAFANKPFFSKDPRTGLLHLFGTDHLGRDVFVRIWYGARVSLLVAGAAALIDTIVGVLYGSISGYLGGTVDDVMMRVVEVIGGIPYLVIVLLLMAVLPQGMGTLILAYTLVGWTGMARLIRGQVRSLCNREFMVAAKIMGAGLGRIMFRHLIPNMMGMIMVNMTLDIPGIIFTEAFLSMLGMGVPAPYPSLGVMVNEGIGVFQTYPAQLLVPALLICLTMQSFNLLGDKLQDSMNPKFRRMIRGKCTKH